MKRQLSGAGVAVVTGAATPTGLSVAVALAEHGCEVIFLGDITISGLETCRDAITKNHPSAKVYIQEFDRSDEGDVDQFLSQVTAIVDRVDYAINVVSQSEDPDMTAEQSIINFDQSFRVYERGAFLIQRALLRQMITQDISPTTDSKGSIVNVIAHGPTPSLAHLPITAMVAFAVIGFSKTDACDYAPDKIRVNCVAASEVMIEKIKAELPGGVPLPRKGRPDDVANAALWLSLPSSSWLTGLVVPVDGGRSLHHWW